MKRFVLPSLLALACMRATALDLPWQAPAGAEQPQFCRGFVVGGLDSKLVGGGSRTELWLAWNYLIRSGAPEPGAASGDYQAGREAFRNAADAAAADAILQNAAGTCGLGRSGHQVTGW